MTAQGPTPAQAELLSAIEDHRKEQEALGRSIQSEAAEASMPWAKSNLEKDGD